MESLTDIPYDPVYLSLLRDIRGGTVTQEDVSNPQTPEDEFHQKVLLDAVLVSCKHCNAKKNVISPELSAHWLALHGKNQLQEIVCNITNKGSAALTIRSGHARCNCQE